MKPQHSLALSAAAALILFSGAAQAESQYGYASSGTGNVTAQASVKLSVTVPKLILLRVGSAGGTQDTLSWTAPLAIPATPTNPVNGNNTAVDWDGTVPTAGTVTDPAAVSVWAWTNSTGGGKVSYTATAFAAGGPSLSDIAVTPGAGLTHPTPVALATASTGDANFVKNAVATGSWAYKLTATGAAGWTAGAYTSTVTYTATSL